MRPLGRDQDGYVEKETLQCLNLPHCLWGLYLDFSHIFYMKLPFSVNFSLLLMDSQLAVENQRDMLTLLGPDSHSQTEHEG